MDKMAIFVEGQTEQQFAEQLVYDIAGRHRVHIDTMHGYGGAKCPRQFLAVTASRPSPKKEYYVLIYDSGTDSRVLPDIIEQHAGLISQGYREIIAIRDVYPLDATQIPTIRSDFLRFTPTWPVTPLLVMAIMEIESWFIAEHTHFSRLHPSLTAAVVNAALGYDPSVHDVQLIPHPSRDLRNAYAQAHLGYNKSRAHVQRTVQVLDYASFYLHLTTRLPDLQSLVRCIDRFLT